MKLEIVYIWLHIGDLDVCHFQPEKLHDEDMSIEHGLLMHHSTLHRSKNFYQRYIYTGFFFLSQLKENPTLSNFFSFYYLFFVIKVWRLLRCRNWQNIKQEWIYWPGIFVKKLDKLSHQKTIFFTSFVYIQKYLVILNWRYCDQLGNHFIENLNSFLFFYPYTFIKVLFYFEL